MSLDRPNPDLARTQIRHEPGKVTRGTSQISGISASARAEIRVARTHLARTCAAFRVSVCVYRARTTGHWVVSRLGWDGWYLYTSPSTCKFSPAAAPCLPPRHRGPRPCAASPLTHDLPPHVHGEAPYEDIRAGDVRHPRAERRASARWRCAGRRARHRRQAQLLGAAKAVGLQISEPLASRARAHAAAGCEGLL